MSKIKIKFMSDHAISTIKQNINVVVEKMMNNGSNQWMHELIGNHIFDEKEFEIEDFSLSISPNGNYKEVDFDNSIKLYESLRFLPRYILADERFWAWINFDKCYTTSLQAITIKKTSTVLNHWLFTNGKRRSIFFGVMSRCFFRVERSVDNSSVDPYELSKFVIHNPERFRNLSWRSYSNLKTVVIGVLRAEKEAEKQLPLDNLNEKYAELAKHISRVGSIKLLDTFSIEEIENIAMSYLLKDKISHETIS